MDQFNQLSQGGKKVVKYPELCSVWNKEVVTQLRSLAPGEDPATVFKQTRFKTSAELQGYAQKAILTVSFCHIS